MKTRILVILLLGFGITVNAQNTDTYFNKSSFYKGLSWQKIKSRFFSYGGHGIEAKWLLNNIPESGGRFLVIAGPEGDIGYKHIAFSIEGNKDATFNGNVKISKNLDLTGQDKRIHLGGISNSTFGISYSKTYPDYGIFYTEGNPDYVSISPNGNSKNGVLNVYGNGKVGIGTSNPDMQLTVKGNIHAQEVKIDLKVPAPDYVFKKEYALRSIEEVEKFIAKNKHLPDIPSAKEFKENGVMQAEMDMNLLKKIEELTLYTISQEKKIKYLEEQNKILTSLVKRVSKLENSK